MGNQGPNRIVGVAAETGKVASGIVDSLKGQPLALSLLVINVLYLLFGAWLLLKVSDRSEARDKMIVQLAARECKGSFTLQSDESKPYQIPGTE